MLHFGHVKHWSHLEIEKLVRFWTFFFVPFCFGVLCSVRFVVVVIYSVFFVVVQSKEHNLLLQFEEPIYKNISIKLELLCVSIWMWPHDRETKRRYKHNFYRYSSIERIEYMVRRSCIHALRGQTNWKKKPFRNDRKLVLCHKCTLIPMEHMEKCQA